MTLRAIAILLLSLAALDRVTSLEPPREAQACGGPEMADLGALDPVDAIATRMSITEVDWQYSDRDELRFLDPFRREHEKELGGLWAFSYDGVQPQPVSTTELDRALAGKDASAKKSAGERFIAAWLALPPVPAVRQKAALIRAATAVDPKAASDLFAVEQAVVKGIPDGWRADVQKKLSPPAARALDRKIDAWIAANPKHPLAAYAALWKVRTRYFASDDGGAWDVIFAAPPTLRVRALAEARYLLLQGVRPSKAQLDAQTDVAWVAGLADRESLDDARFAKWWALAESQPSRKAALSLEERMLHWVATRPTTGPAVAKLPPSFPREARAPTPYWAEMRAAALIRGGDSTDALAQLAKLPAKDPARPELEASAHLAARHPERAAQVVGLAPDARRYLLAVLVSPPDLEKLAQTAGQAGAAPRLELALRTGAGGAWRKAADLVDKDDPMRAKLWRDLAALEAAKGPLAGLHRARFLDEKSDVLFDAPDNPTYRSMSARHDPKARPVESRAIELAMERRSARFQALGAYVDWLEKNPTDAEAKLALAEADATYNRLVNFSGDDTLHWGRLLPKSELAKRLRAAGKAVRGKP